MKKLILLLILCFVFANLAHARLGETLAELEKRFGKGKLQSKIYTKPPFTTIYEFKKNGVTIRAYFVGGNQCDMISYSAPAGQHLKPENIQTLLAINSQDSKWKKLSNPDLFKDAFRAATFKESWKREDGKMFAFKTVTSTLAIFTQNYIDKQKEHDKKVAGEKAKKEKHKLDGF